MDCCENNKDFRGITSRKILNLCKYVYPEAISASLFMSKFLIYSCLCCAEILLLNYQKNKNVTRFINIMVKEKDYDRPLYLFASQYRLICSINNDNILRQ